MQSACMQNKSQIDRKWEQTFTYKIWCCVVALTAFWMWNKMSGENRINLTDGFGPNRWKYVYQMYGIRWKQKDLSTKRNEESFLKPQTGISNIAMQHESGEVWIGVAINMHTYIIQYNIISTRYVYLLWFYVRLQWAASIFAVSSTQQNNLYEFHFNFKSLESCTSSKNCHFLNEIQSKKLILNRHSLFNESQLKEYLVHLNWF